MELGTFGAVLTFAISFEQHLAASYRQMLANAPAALSGSLTQAAEAAAKRGKLLERVRRENVAEMILEPIREFASEEYALAEVPGAGSAADDFAGALRQAEQTAERFYTVGAQKLSIPEVKRIFERLAKEHARLAA